MAGRKLVRDLFLPVQPLCHRVLTYQQLQFSNTRLRSIEGNGYLSNRGFSVFNEFSKKIKGEASSNKEFQQSVKELKEKAEELKGVKEELKIRMKQTTGQLHKHVDGVWIEAEETAKKVSANVKEKISAAKDEVKETLGFGKQESSSSADSSENSGTNVNDGTKNEHHQSEPSGNAETVFGKFRSTISSSPKVTLAFQKLKEAKVADLAKKSYGIVIEELSGKSNKRRQTQHAASSVSKGERSDRTEMVVVPSKQSRWSKTWEAVKEKMRGHPMFKRVTKISEPVLTKSQELAEDIQERWETSDSPVVHKIQDINDRVFGENDAALAVKEIRRRDPSFSLPDFVDEVQEVIKPVLNAYTKGDFEVLAKYCSPEIVERCKAEHKFYETQGIFYDNKILHISEVELFERKMMGASPIIVLRFQTQEVHCVRDRQGSITEGSKDDIHMFIYGWAMQQMEPEEVGEDAIYSMWRLREMQKAGIAAALI